VTNKSVAVIGAGSKAVGRRNNNSTPAKLMAAGLALTRDQLSDEVVQHFIAADDCSNTLGRWHWLSCISVTAPADEVERAKMYYRSALPRAVQADDAADFLGQLRDPYEPITRAQASAMLHALFASMGKRRDDEAAMAKLSACADVFTPEANALGRALKLWAPVPMHPVTLALAIKQLRATKTFEPSEAELREALDKVAKESRRLERAADEWLQRLRATDAVMFKTDPDGWRGAHADNDAILVMSDDGDDAYLEAIEAMWDEKFDDYGNPRAKAPALAAEAPQQIGGRTSPCTQAQIRTPTRGA
jgi:hypothetical protein